jgi:uridine phosphorylase
MMTCGRAIPKSFIPTYNDLFIDRLKGWTYHLNLKPEDFVPNVLIVGDPGRALMIGEEFLEEVRVKREHRGLASVVGRAKSTGQELLVTTSGMGTASLEIVLNELAVLRMYDFETGARKRNYPRMNIIRIGTSGALAPDVRAGTCVVAYYSVGLDAAGHAYVGRTDARLKALENQVYRAMMKHRRAGAYVPRPYAARADGRLSACLSAAAKRLGIRAVDGITVTAAGLFNGQGRAVAGIPEYVPDLDFIIGALKPPIAGMRYANTEMESALAFRYLREMRRSTKMCDRASAICVAVDNRHHDELDDQVGEHVRQATAAAILALASFRDKFGK